MAGGVVLAPGGQRQAVGRYATNPPEGHRHRHCRQGNGHGSKDTERNQAAGGRIDGPQCDAPNPQDGELAGGEVGQQAVLTLDVGRDAYPSRSPVPPERTHNAAPAARALTPL